MSSEKWRFTDQGSKTKITILFLGVLGVLGVVCVITAGILNAEDLEEREDKDGGDHGNDNHHADASTGGLSIVFLINH